MSRNAYAALLFSFLIALAAGCEQPGNSTTAGKTGSGDSATTGSSNLSGSVAIEGSSTVEPISNRAKEKFNDGFPNVNIAVSGQGTGNGFKALGAKECDLSDASRPIKQKELDVCQAAGVNFYEVPVAYDGLTIVVNKENDFVKQLTVEHPGRAFDRSELIDSALGADTLVLERTIDVHIRSLRKKLGLSADAIQTVRGVGYRFRESANADT